MVEDLPNVNKAPSSIPDPQEKQTKTGNMESLPHFRRFQMNKGHSGAILCHTQASPKSEARYLPKVAGRAHIKQVQGHVVDVTVSHFLT